VRRSDDDTTPLAELRRKFVAALAVLCVVSIGVLAVVSVLHWFE
jgi:hypothetical protein